MLYNWRTSTDYPWTKALPEKVPIKGMIFLGCSFTWGQGLYYYSNLNSLREPPPNCYDSLIVSTSHVKFLESVRYPRIVARHFNTFEHVAPFNGGSNEGAIEWAMKEIFSNPNHNYKYSDFEDYSHVIFQLTQWERNHISIENNDGIIDVHNGLHRVHPEVLTEYLLKNNMTMNEFEIMGMKNNLREVKEFLMFLESKGIKTYVMSWPDYYHPFILEDDFLRDRYLTFSYKEKQFTSIENLMDHNPEMRINSDYSEFRDTPKDHHPSLKCHQLMAETVIKKIKTE
jgi:hypothetical protein